jgi:hypothetical protein
MNSKTPDGNAPVSCANQPAASRENVALQPQLPVLAAQAGELVAFGCGQPVTFLLPAALLPVGLHDPLADRLCRRLELAGKIGRITAGPDKIDHLATGLRRISRAWLGHVKPLFESPKAHQTGSTSFVAASAVSSFVATASTGLCLISYGVLAIIQRLYWLRYRRENRSIAETAGSRIPLDQVRSET